MISIIIPFRLEMRDRLDGLRYLLSWYRGMQGSYEIIIVEQDSHPKLPSEYQQEIKYCFVKNSGLFNRSWGFNVGVHLATKNLLAFCDADIAMREKDFRLGVEALEKFQAVNPYKRIVDLSPALTEKVKENQLMIEQIEPDQESIDRAGINFSGGMLFMRKSAFFEINGWPEEIRGWGTEDNIMTLKIQRALTFEEMDATAYHLYHNPGLRKQHIFFEVNRAIWKRYIEFPNFRGKQHIGNENEFSGVPHFYRELKFRLRHRKLISSHYHHRLLDHGNLGAGFMALTYNPFSGRLILNLLLKILHR
jgi:glycosyltransferase involved in cell wall biosynthesis